MFRKHRSLSWHVFILSLVFLASQTVAAQSKNLKADLSSELKKFTLVKRSAEMSADQTARSRTINLTAEDRDYTISLVPNDLRSARYRAEETGPDGVKEIPFGGVNTYKGKVAGDDGSSARFFIDGNKIEGYFFTGSDKFFVEPASHFSRAAAPDDLVIYRMEDMLRPAAFNFENHVHQKMEAGMKTVAPGLVPEVVNLRVIELGTEADFEFVNATGGSLSTNADVMNSINMVEGVYENELGITIDVVFQHTWTVQDPYIAVNTDGLVRAFQGYWNLTYPTTQVPRDTAHLWTGKSYALSAGYAFVDVICNHPESAYGLTGKLEWVPAKYMITAHEIGHNLSATHVEAAQSCANTLMNAQLTTTTPFTFCTASRDQINAHVAASGGCMDTRTSNPARYDFDGDGKADIGVFRPSDGNWFILNSGDSSFSIFHFGQNGDKPVAGDYDGDGKTDAAIYRNGSWYRLRSSNGTVDGVGFGLTNDIPVPEDFDGDNKMDVAVYRPSEGRWYILPTGTSVFYVTQFGIAEDIPVPGDFDGDGRADVNVFRPSMGTWFRTNSRDGAFVANQFGSAGDKPQAGDIDGDGRADLINYRPSNGGWYTYNSATTNVWGVIFGFGTDIPVPADFDGDGKTDVAVFRPSEGNWYRLNSSTGAFVVYNFGNSADIPASAR